MADAGAADGWDFPDEDDEVGPESAPGAAHGATPSASASPEAAAAPVPEPPGTHAAVAHADTPTWAEFKAGWDLGIYKDPVLCGLLAGAALGLLGVLVVLRRAVFVTATVSQAAGLGVALSFYAAIHFGLSVPPVVGAFSLSLLATASVLLPAERFRLPREAALGFMFIAASSAAVLVGDRISQEAHDVAAILFGTAVLVTRGDLLAVAGVGALVVVVTVVARRGLVFTGFDGEGARVQGLPTGALNLLVWVLVAAQVSVSTRALGSLPVFAFAVLPGMTALALVERMRWALWIAAIVGAASGVLGYLAAFFFEFPVGASQAAVAALFFLGALGVAAARRR